MQLLLPSLASRHTWFTSICHDLNGRMTFSTVKGLIDIVKQHIEMIKRNVLVYISTGFLIMDEHY